MGTNSASIQNEHETNQRLEIFGRKKLRLGAGQTRPDQSGHKKSSSQEEERMPRFYMNVRSVAEFLGDYEGQEFPSLGAAGAAALKTAYQIMAIDMRDGNFMTSSDVEVTDETGVVLLRFPFSKAIERDGPRIRKI